MTDDEIKEMIQKHEGYRPYVYYDSLGFPTAGYGHAFLPRSPISHDVAIALFEDDWCRAKRDYDKLKLDLDPVRRGVVLDMLFNLGLPRFRGFAKMITALSQDDYETASKEGLDSLWAKQIKGRANHLMKILRTGEWE